MKNNGYRLSRAIDAIENNKNVSRGKNIETDEKGDNIVYILLFVFSLMLLILLSIWFYYNYM